uniref:Uncharacterized protein n=1 Tax=Anguilla anguilla TaxID=7936 RepID=A0A0E9QUD4_ANGAN
MSLYVRMIITFKNYGFCFVPCYYSKQIQRRTIVINNRDGRVIPRALQV